MGEILMPTLAEAMEQFPPPIPDACLGGDQSSETIAWGMAVYEGVKPSAFDSHRYLAMQLAWDYKPGNLWILPTKDRLPYPYAVLFAVAAMFKTEKQAGRKADWFLWVDDDVIVPRNLVRVLRTAADPKDRPVMAAVGYDRMPQYHPAVWVNEKQGDLTISKQWEDMPDSGVYQVDGTGLCACLIHRSVFERVPEPWFAVSANFVGGQSGVSCGMAPDAWFSNQCRMAGIPIHVCCDVVITHLSLPAPINKFTAKRFRTPGK